MTPPRFLHIYGESQYCVHLTQNHTYRDPNNVIPLQRALYTAIPLLQLLHRTIHMESQYCDSPPQGPSYKGLNTVTPLLQGSIYRNLNTITPTQDTTHRDSITVSPLQRILHTVITILWLPYTGSYIQGFHYCGSLTELWWLALITEYDITAP